MRKAPKIMLITAAALIGTGTVLSCGAWAVAGFDTARLSTVNYDWHQTVSTLEDEATSPHKSIVITSEFENVLLEPADGDAIELEYWTGNCQSVSVEDTDGVLKIDVDSQPMEGVMIDLSPAEAGGVDYTTTVGACQPRSPVRSRCTPIRAMSLRLTCAGSPGCELPTVTGTSWRRMSPPPSSTR